MYEIRCIVNFEELFVFRREERIKQERDAASNTESVKSEEKTDTEAAKTDVPTADAPKTNDVSSQVEKKEDK